MQLFSQNNKDNKDPTKRKINIYKYDESLAYY